MQRGLGRRSLAIAGIAGGLSLPGAAAPPARPWTMSAPPIPIAPARHYQRLLFELALSKVGWPNRVQLTPTLSWRRQMRELQLGRVDVATLPATSNEDDPGYGLLRVDFTLRGGLLGVRRLVALRSRIDALAAVPDLGTLLREHTLGYGADWADLPHMQRLGVRLRTAATLPKLYDMLRRGEVDYLSRGLNEYVSELPVFGQGTPDIALVPGLVLHYPLDDCFFVSPSQPDLHAALTEGLQRAARAGSHAALLREHYGAELAQLKGARSWALAGYPAATGLPPAQFEAWKAWVPAQAPVASRSASARAPLLVASGQLNHDPRNRFAFVLLGQALERSGQRFELLPQGGLSIARQWRELERGQLDVCQLLATPPVSTTTSLRVPIPMRRGLLGLRLLLARRERADEIAALPSVERLKAQLRFGHGAEWGDTPLMREAGLQVVTRTAYPDLFRLLESGGCDVLSRSVAEVWGELNDPRLAGGGRLVVVPRIALHYPLDDCFWVSPRRPELAEAIAAGLRALQADGSFDALLRERYGRDLQRAELAQRVVWRLPGIAPPAGMDAALFDGWRGLAAPGLAAAPAR